MRSVIVLLCLVCVAKSDSKNLYSHAVHEIIENYFANKSINHNIIACGANDKLLQEIANFRDERFSRKIVHGNSSLRLDESAILLFDSVASHDDFNTKVQFDDNALTSFNFLVVYATPQLVENIRLEKYTPVLQYQLIIAKCAETFCLYSFRRFQSGSRVDSFTEVNRFSLENQTWISKSFYEQERNFHGAEIIIRLQSLNPSTDWKILDNGTVHVFGLGIDIIESLTKSLNFTIKYSVCSETSCSNGGGDFLLVIMGYQGLQLVKTSLSATIMSSDHTFLIPGGEPYTPFEKLILPFDPDVWMWFLIFIGAGILVIFLVKLMPKDIQIFVFGRDVNTPTLNLFQIFFGIGQFTLPSRNFARYLLTMFILFCLVMRTAYQGIMFKFMQEEIRKPEVQSIEEMIRQNFTFLAEKDVQKVFEKMEILNGATYMNFSYHDRENDLRNVSDPKRKLSLFTSRTDALYMIEKFKSKIHLSVLKENLYTDQLGLAFHCPNIYSFYDPFNEKIVKLIEGGIVNTFFLKYPELSTKKSEVKSEPSVLGLGQLSIGFEIWLSCLVVSFVVFVFEHFYAMFQRLFRVQRVAPKTKKKIKL